MSHEMMSPERRMVYTLPAWPSDVLRSRQFQQFFRSYRGAAFSVQTKDGWRWYSSPVREPAFRAVFSSRDQLDAVINESSEDSLAKLFLDGNLEIQGEISALLFVAEFVLRHSNGLSHPLVHTVSRAALSWFKRLKRSNRSSLLTGWRLTNCSAELPVEFFEPWLGTSLGHFCGRFRDPAEPLGEAQQHALEHACDQLKLSEDDPLLDMSCGWGGLLLYAAANRGVQGFGISFCEQQADFVTNRLLRGRLSARCTAQAQEPQPRPRFVESFEKIADIGTFHQVAHSCLPAFLDTAFQVLRPGGLLLLHRTTRSASAGRRAKAGLYVEAPILDEIGSLPEELRLAEAAGFEVCSSEELTRDYQLTLHHWIERLQGCTKVSPVGRQRDCRKWLFHLLDTATKLDTGDLRLHQILLSRPDPDAIATV